GCADILDIKSFSMEKEQSFQPSFFRANGKDFLTNVSLRPVPASSMFLLVLSGTEKEKSQ
ncbi:MAG: hypothetical protein II622_05890, partial [Thermoguttaceae bacterium]|nr:hypothetical protein [Thermoguttaceae bacterium]